MFKSLLVGLAILTGCTWNDPNAQTFKEFAEISQVEMRVYTDQEICWDGWMEWSQLGSFELEGDKYFQECGYGYYEFPVSGNRNYEVSLGGRSELCSFWYQPPNSRTLLQLQLFINDELVDEDSIYIGCGSFESFKVSFSS